MCFSVAREEQIFIIILANSLIQKNILRGYKHSVALYILYE
jgi:hypothetical protein